MLTVNMTGRESGIALMNRMSMSGIISNSGVWRRKDAMTTMASSTPTTRKSQPTTFAITASMCNFGRACCTSSVVRPK